VPVDAASVAVAIHSADSANTASSLVPGSPERTIAPGFKKPVDSSHCPRVISSNRVDDRLTTVRCLRKPDDAGAQHAE
jgi:hypothetical protein